MEEERSGTNDASAEPEEDSVEPITDKFKGKKGGKIKSRRNTAPATSQGYQTIRTQLQHKRASINKTIGHEVELKKGASRLIRYSQSLSQSSTMRIDCWVGGLTRHTATQVQSLVCPPSFFIRSSTIALNDLFISVL